jgi:hypothetical protein
MLAMTSPYKNNKTPQLKPKSDGHIPAWQMAIGGIFIACGGMFAGGMIAEMALPFLLPGLLR